MKYQVSDAPPWIYTWFDIRRGTDVTNHNKLHGCLIIKNSFRPNKINPCIMSYGQNAERPSPFVKNGRVSMHAEMNAIYRIPRNRGKVLKVDLIVFRINKQNALMESLPCSLCMGCIANTLHRAGYICRNIWFSTRKGVFIGRRFSELHEEYEQNLRDGTGWGPKRDATRRLTLEDLKK